jgi:starvation-inducible DNA-binding protein
MTSTITQTTKFTTKNDLAESVREKMIGLLNGALADAIHLQLHAKMAHWNVKGPHFISLHELFDQVHAQAGEWTDDIAERAVQLGGVAVGTLARTTANSSLSDYDLERTAGPDHVEAVASSLATFGKRVRAAIDTAGGAGDQDTADLFTGVSRGVDKMLWFVEAHLQSDR